MQEHIDAANAAHEAGNGEALRASLRQLHHHHGISKNMLVAEGAIKGRHGHISVNNPQNRAKAINALRKVLAARMPAPQAEAAAEAFVEAVEASPDMAEPSPEAPKKRKKAE